MTETYKLVLFYFRIGITRVNTILHVFFAVCDMHLKGHFSSHPVILFFFFRFFFFYPIFQNKFYLFPWQMLCLYIHTRSRNKNFNCSLCMYNSYCISNCLRKKRLEKACRTELKIHVWQSAQFSVEGFHQGVFYPRAPRLRFVRHTLFRVLVCLYFAFFFLFFFFFFLFLASEYRFSIDPPQ